MVGYAVKHTLRLSLQTCVALLGLLLVNLESLFNGLLDVRVLDLGVRDALTVRACEVDLSLDLGHLGQNVVPTSLNQFPLDDRIA